MKVNMASIYALDVYLSIEFWISHPTILLVTFKYDSIGKSVPVKTLTNVGKGGYF